MPRDRRAGLLRLARACGPRPPQLDAELASLAAREGLAPFLGARLARGEVTAGDDVAATLARAHREELARGLVRERAVRPLTLALAAVEIPLLLLKGAALERSAVYRPGERPMNDVDVLVPPSRFAEAVRLALGLGAEPLGQAARPITGRFEYAVGLALPPGVGVEIHRAVTPSVLFAVDIPALLRRAEPCADGALVPDPTDLFLLLALHAAKHGFCLPFRAVVDGLRLAAMGAGGPVGLRSTGGEAKRSPQIDPGALLERARAFRARRALATWLGVLEAFGLEPMRVELGPVASAAAALLRRSAPWPDDAGGWTRRARIALSVEGLRGAGWLLMRTGLRLADLLATRTRSQRNARTPGPPGVTNPGRSGF